MSANKKRSRENALKKSDKIIKKARRSCTYIAKITTTTEERDHARKCAEKFQDDLRQRHLSFIKIMLPSHVTRGFWLGLPKSFCDKYLPSDKRSMELIDENDVKYDSNLIGNGLSGGWVGFAKDHKLDEGDALVFELTGELTFKVYIFKAREGQESETPDENDLEPKKATDIEANDGLDFTRPEKLTNSPSDDTPVQNPKLKVEPKKKSATGKTNRIPRTSSQKAQGDASKVQPVCEPKATKSGSWKTRKPATVKMLTRKVFSDTRFDIMSSMNQNRRA